MKPFFRQVKRSGEELREGEEIGDLGPTRGL